VNASNLQKLSMKISSSPRELEQLRTATRMGIYLELKQVAVKHCPGKYTKPECSRISMEVERRLCGDPAAPGAVPLAPEMQQATTEVLALIRKLEPEIMVAASFMRWSKAAGLLMRMKNQEAEVELNAALEYDPKNAFALCSLAYLAGFQGDARGALALSQRAIEINPGLPEALLEMGNAYEALGEHDHAREAWEKARKIVPDMVKLDDAPARTAEELPGRERLNYDVLTDEPDDTTQPSA
jgi:tetratricopeptide (TPR) repeat protein